MIIVHELTPVRIARSVRWWYAFQFFTKLTFGF